MAVFISMFTDFGFKRLFGQEDNKGLLIGFLNVLFEGEFVVQDVVYRDKERIGKRREQRCVIFDIFCTTDGGDHFILEMQNKSQVHFEDRALYYAAEGIVEQGKKGKWNFSFDAFFGIYFLNFLQDGLPDKVRSDFGIRMLGNDDPKDLPVLTRKLRMIFLQLPLVPKTPEECKTRLEQYLYVVNNMESLKEMPWKDKEKWFDDMAEAASVAALSAEEREIYDEELHAIWDSYSVREYEIVKATEEGREEGKIEVAQSMIAEGMSDTLIHKLTQLPVDEINKLREKTE